MPNEVKLQEGHPLDENLRPIKVGGKSSAIETAQSGNGARVSGDLEVTGDVYATIEKMYLGLVPAYSGTILGYTSLLNDSADTSYGVTTSFVSIDSDANVTFVAPPSGNVEIFASVFCKWTQNRWLQFGLSDNATYNTLDVTHEHFIGEGDETDEMQLNHRWVITGLTAGTSYQYWLGAKAEQAGRVTLYWGGDATGEYAPFIMKAIALPKTIAGE